MANIEANPFFTAMQAQGSVIVEEMPKFDLEPYVQNYQGPTKFERILLIGRCSVPLYTDALKAAVAEAKKGKDVQKYQEAWSYLRLALPNDPDAVFDQAWADKTTAANAETLARLRSELKVYKNNMVKDSIRMGHEEIGRHLEATGDLAGATEAFTLMRLEVTTAKNLVKLGKHLTRVGIQRREWATVLAQLSKITGLQDKSEEKPNLPYVRALSGLALLNQDKFEAAAKSFLEAGNSAVAPAGSGSGSTAASATAAAGSGSTSVPSVESMAELTEGIMTTNDVAVYGGLLALATMDRAGLQKHVLDNSKFRAYLELEPHVRRAISQFVNGRYKVCLETLASYRADWRLDLFLQKHVDKIFAQIRRKCITSYLAPFSIALFSNMDEAFSAPGESMEAELVTMIKSGALNAQVDSINKLVRIRKDSGRAKMQSDAIAAISKFRQDSLDRLRRTNIIAAQLETRTPKSEPATPGDGMIA